LKKTQTGFNFKETQQNYPLQEIKTKPHSKTIVQEEIINHQTTIKGNILYALNTNKNLRESTNFYYHAGKYNVTDSYYLCEALDTIRKNNMDPYGMNVFQPDSDALLVYKDNQYFYSFPVA
jgi:hypothetical protein